MNQIKPFHFFITFFLIIISFSCEKKINSRDGYIEPQQSTTTVGPGGSTTSSSSPAAATSISGFASCTLTPKQIICSNYLPSTTFSYGSNFQDNITNYKMYNINGNIESSISFGSVGLPAVGGYTIIPKYISTDALGPWEASVKISQFGTLNAIGVGQDGVVYVTKTGTLVTASYCNVAMIVNFNSNNYSITASARIEN